MRLCSFEALDSEISYRQQNIFQLDIAKIFRDIAELWVSCSVSSTLEDSSIAPGTD